MPAFPLNRPADTFSPTGEKDWMRGPRNTTKMSRLRRWGGRVRGKNENYEQAFANHQPKAVSGALLREPMVRQGQPELL